MSLLSGTPALAELFAMARKVAKSPDTPVLVLGERGSGAEDVARFIHDKTPSRGPHHFVPIHCRGVREDVLERTIFGRGRANGGAAGAAIRARPGTLFIDEVGSLGPVAQDLLTRLLEGERPTARRRSIKGGVRVIASARESLDQLVEQGLFREDLLEALSVFRLRIPPLRERPEDIAPTAEGLVRERAKLLGKAIRGIAPAAMQKLRDHCLPGNLRELEAVMERAVICESGDSVSSESVSFAYETDVGVAASFSDMFATSFRREKEPPSLAEVERTYIVWILGRTSGNRTAAARILGVSYPTIAKKIADYKIDMTKLLGPPSPQPSPHPVSPSR